MVFGFGGSKVLEQYQTMSKSSYVTRPAGSKKKLFYNFGLPRSSCSTITSPSVWSLMSCAAFSARSRLRHNSTTFAPLLLSSAQSISSNDIVAQQHVIILEMKRTQALTNTTTMCRSLHFRAAFLQSKARKRQYRSFNRHVTKAGRSANKFRKSQIRKFADLNDLLDLRIFRKCDLLWICDLRNQSFLLFTIV